MGDLPQNLEIKVAYLDSTEAVFHINQQPTLTLLSEIVEISRQEGLNPDLMLIEVSRLKYPANGGYVNWQVRLTMTTRSTLN